MADSILFHEYGVQLRVWGDNALILNVLCGTVGEFGVEFALNESERENYNREGDVFIKSLARDVSANPERFIHRGRTC